jgi:hypothetical protein
LAMFYKLNWTKVFVQISGQQQCLWPAVFSK